MCDVVVLIGESVENDCGCGDGLLRSEVILGIIIWLLLLTILNIILLVVLLVVRQSDTPRSETSSTSSSSSPTQTRKLASARRNPIQT